MRNISGIPCNTWNNRAFYRQRHLGQKWIHMLNHICCLMQGHRDWKTLSVPGSLTVWVEFWCKLSLAFGCAINASWHSWGRQSFKLPGARAVTPVQIPLAWVGTASLQLCRAGTNLPSLSALADLVTHSLQGCSFSSEGFVIFEDVVDFSTVYLHCSCTCTKLVFRGCCCYTIAKQRVM